MAFEHSSGLPGAYDRSPSRPNDARLVFVEGNMPQAAEMNEVQGVEARRNRRLGDMVTSDGRRVTGAEIVLTRVSADAPTGTAALAAGRVYVKGDVRDIAARVLTGVPMTGTVRIGIRLVTTLVTWEDDPTLYGLAPGSIAEGEAGAARQVETASWALEGDGGDGEFYPVYTIRDAAVIDQSVAPDLTGVKAILAEQDSDAHGNYVVRGCEVTALGKVGTAQRFSIQPGVANILGWKRTRRYALTHDQVEEPDLELISAETHIYPSSDPAVITLRNPPAASIDQVVIQKRHTATVTRGPVPGGIDALEHTSVVAIESVSQGGTPISSTAYALASDGISWAPSGAEPAASSTYQVTYLHNAPVVPSVITETTIQVAGGVSGTPALVTYHGKLPRIDLLCLNDAGETAYVKGISARKGASAPIVPTTLLKLAEIHNVWMGVPTVVNNAVHAIVFDVQARYNARVVDIISAYNRIALEHDIRGRVISSLKGIFFDPLTSDYFRDAGAPQTAAVVDGCLVLAVDLVGVELLGTQPYTLPYVEEVVVEQLLSSSAMAINPYANFVSLPADMRLEPAVDFWVSRSTVYTSPETADFTTVTDSVPPGTVTSVTTITEEVAERQEVATTLRPIDLQVTINGFGIGERLDALTFDGVDVLPAGEILADAAGKIITTITIPDGVPTGTRLVRADGAAGTFAEALFHGEGTIQVETLREITLVTRAVRSTVINVTNVTNVMTTSGGGDGGGAHDSGAADPLAETFLLSAPRQLIGSDVRIAAVGDRTKGVRLQLAGASNGQPSTEVLAQAFQSMATPAVGAWVAPRWALPVYVPPVDERAIVILTDDPTHALSIARLGDVVTEADETQWRIAQNPSNVGVLLSSSNRRTWTPHNDADLTFRIVAARYTVTERLVVLGTVDLVNISDLVVRGTIELPTEACSVVFEVVRADGTVLTAAPDQTIEFGEFVTETVTVRARLKGTATLSPILYPGVSVGLGRLRTTGDYVSKVIPFKAPPADLRAVIAANLPSGATVAIDWDEADGDWTALAVDATEALADGWVELTYLDEGVAATQGRIRIRLTGGPAARPELARIRAFTI
jgi:hypothetical protein